LAFTAGMAGLIALYFYPDVVKLIEDLQAGKAPGQGAFANDPILGKKADEVLLPKVLMPTSHANAAISYQDLAAEEERYEPLALQH
jgi:hypothetical protein